MLGKCFLFHNFVPQWVESSILIMKEHNSYVNLDAELLLAEVKTTFRMCLFVPIHHCDCMKNINRNC